MARTSTRRSWRSKKEESESEAESSSGENSDVKSDTEENEDAETSGVKETNGAAEPKPMKVETKHLESHYDSKGYEHVKEAGSAPKRKTKVDKWGHYVLNYTRHFDADNDRYMYSSVEIKSRPLKKLLGETIRNYPGESFATDKIVLTLPSKALFHYLPEMYEKLAAMEKELEGVALGQTAADAKTNGTVNGETNGEVELSEEIKEKVETRNHLKFLLDWFEEEEADLLHEYRNLIGQGLIMYPLLWTVFRPGCTVYAPLHGQPRAFKLTNSWAQKDFYVLEVSYIDYDGKRFGRRSTQLRVFPFAGSNPVTSLEAYPLSWHAKAGAVRDALAARGRRFEALQGKQYLSYSGIALGEVINCMRIKYNINGRVMVDCETFSRIQTSRAVTVTPLKARAAAAADDDDAVDDDECDDEYSDDDEEEFAPGAAAKRSPTTLTDEQCVQATNLVAGFAFAEKKWVEFYVDRLGPIKWNDRAFDHLVLPAQQKSLVKALVENHVRETDRLERGEESGFDDVIKGKGRGLISILHGPPGVGKTLTAESVAEYTKRPLYAVSSGELGVDSRELEASLARILDVATVWKAVLLLDEADVFLEQRSAHDIERNALVSIFLRLLEYYEGILFLTTNKVQTFDDAFQSRIHVALKYARLSAPARRSVWSNFMRTVPGAAVDAPALDALAQHDLNGRQIKNAIRTAKSLADSEGDGVVTRRTLETVLDIQKDFDRDFRESHAAANTL